MNIISRPSPHFNERLLPVDALIIHYTDMVSAKAALDWLVHPSSQVSAHYLIDEEGTIFQLVDEDKRAWHAGESAWQGCRDINSCSIGIELANPGHSHGYLPFPDAQIESLISLSKAIQKRWDIPTSRVLGHSDIAPLRKQDPGHLFPWKRLAEEGLGVWASTSAAPRSDPRELLHQIGYDTSDLKAAILAFQRHYQPHKLDGEMDKETLSLAQALLTTQKELI